MPKLRPLHQPGLWVEDVVFFNYVTYRQFAMLDRVCARPGDLRNRFKGLILTP